MKIDTKSVEVVYICNSSRGHDIFGKESHLNLIPSMVGKGGGGGAKTPAFNFRYKF